MRGIERRIMAVRDSTADYPAVSARLLGVYSSMLRTARSPSSGNGSSPVEEHNLVVRNSFHEIFDAVDDSLSASLLDKHQQASFSYFEELMYQYYLLDGSRVGLTHVEPKIIAEAWKASGTKGLPSLKKQPLQQGDRNTVNVFLGRLYYKLMELASTANKRKALLVKVYRPRKEFSEIAETAKASISKMLAAISKAEGKRIESPPPHDPASKEYFDHYAKV